MVRFDRQSPGGHVSVKRLETFGGVVSTLCLKDGTIVSFFVSSLTDIIFVLKYSAHIQTSTSPPPLQWPPVLAFLSTRSCDSCEVGGWHGGIGMINDEKDGMVEKACIQTSRSPPPLQWFPVLVFLSTRKIVIRARWERMAWRNWYDER